MANDAPKQGTEWMQPGKEAWFWGFLPPRRVFLTSKEPDGVWNFTFADEGDKGMSSHGYLCPDELSAQRAFLEDDLADLANLQARIEATKARIAEQEARGE
jgi:hypothetical protein